MRVQKITDVYFNEVKKSLHRKWRWTRYTNRHLVEVAYTHGISLKTVMQIKNSDTYQDYVDLCKSQHPETKYSLADDVLALHKTVFDKGGEYHTPKTAQTAITQLNYELAKK